MNLERINVGCGEHQHDGWLNVDSAEFVGAEVTARVSDLPTVLGYRVAKRVYAGHLLEHVEIDEVPSAILAMLDVLGEGGELALVGPDWPRAVRHVREGLEPESLLETVKHGDCEWPGDEHRWLSHESTVKGLLDALALPYTVTDPSSLRARGWPIVSEIGWQYAIVVQDDSP